MLFSSNHLVEIDATRISFGKSGPNVHTFFYIGFLRLILSEAAAAYTLLKISGNLDLITITYKMIP